MISLFTAVTNTKRRRTESPTLPVSRKDLLDATFNERAITPMGKFDRVNNQFCIQMNTRGGVICLWMIIPTHFLLCIDLLKPTARRRSKVEEVLEERETGTHSMMEACKEHLVPVLHHLGVAFGWLDQSLWSRSYRIVFRSPFCQINAMQVSHEQRASTMSGIVWRLNRDIFSLHYEVETCGIHCWIMKYIIDRHRDKTSMKIRKSHLHHTKQTKSSSICHKWTTIYVHTERQR